MKRYLSCITLGGLIVGVLLGMPVFRGAPSGIIASVHAQVPKDTEGCSVATLNGVYGFFRTGITSAGPLAAVGLITFDGTGAHSPARQTIRRNGLTVRDLFADAVVDGPYEVDPDCAGRFLNFDGSVAGHFVVVDGGKELFILSLSDANDVYGVMRRIGGHQDR